MTVALYPGQRLGSSPSKTVNVFDLTLKNNGITAESSKISSAKVKAARITVIVIITMLVLTAITVLLAEVFELQWTPCFKQHNKTSVENWYRCPWNWKQDRQSFAERWNSLSLPQKREELLRASRGDIDLYDLYNYAKIRLKVDLEEKK